jgi:TetR/AcrR family transcriptional regulator, transcriptional repressor for nem operon
MPRPKSFDEEALLDRAVKLFQERGYEATSLSDLETHLGVGRQSLYNTFGDKRALYMKALRRYHEGVKEGALGRLSAPGAGLEQIRTFFRESIELLTAPGPKRTCLVANTILERGSEDTEALSSCNQARAGLERAFRQALSQAKRRGEIDKRVDVDATAMLLVIQNYGLNILAKAGVSAEELHRTVDVLLAELE